MVDVTVAFDTLKAATRLQQAGFDEGKARALVSTFAEGLVENLATRQDLAPLATKEEIAKLATKEEIAKLATKEEVARLATKEELAALRSETKAGLATLRAEIAKVQERMTVRMGTAIGAAVAVLVAIDKLL